MEEAIVSRRSPNGAERTQVDGAFARGGSNHRCFPLAAIASIQSKKSFGEKVGKMSKPYGRNSKLWQGDKADEIRGKANIRSKCPQYPCELPLSELFKPAAMDQWTKPLSR
jgi:hypothetical protein